MLILNFTHPLTDEHKAQIEALAGLLVDEIRIIPVQIDQDEPLEAQIVAIVESMRPRRCRYARCRGCTSRARPANSTHFGRTSSAANAGP